MDSIKDYVGYVIGWRWWLFDEKVEHPNPCSIGCVHRWNWMGENLTGNLAPANRFGFHAYKTESIENLESVSPLLFGRVALYGDVVTHEHGYRAEKARILDVWCSPAWRNKFSGIKQIKGTYSVTHQGDTEWLTLANHEKLIDTILLDFPMMPLRSRNRYL